MSLARARCHALRNVYEHMCGTALDSALMSSAGAGGCRERQGAMHELAGADDSRSMISEVGQDTIAMRCDPGPSASSTA